MEKARLKERWPEAAIIGVTAFLFWMKGLFAFLTVSDLAGRDLVGNYAFTWLMRRNLLHGELFRWTNQWLLGLPSFKLYPPFFFLLTSGLDVVTGGVVGLKAWFLTVVFLSVFLTPLTGYLSFRKLFGKKEAFFAGFYLLYFVFVYPPVSQSYQVFSTGLVAQGLAFLLLLPALALILQKRGRKLVAGGILLGIVGLTHPFVAIGGFLTAGFYTLLTRDIKRAIPAGVGFLVMLPWLAKALSLLQYVSTYTFQPANTGILLYLLLPLIVLGGYKGVKRRSLLLSFFTLLGLSVIELPVVSQELRFYTYALGFGSVLAGMGAFQVLNYVEREVEADAHLVGVLLLVPVIGLSLHAGLPQTWEFNGNAQPLYEELQGVERGRVLVETANSSIFDSYVLQEKIPMETKHWAVNELHLDSSTSANYILTLESWVSYEALYNPICRTCNTTASNGLINERMDDLGVRYVVARTRAARKHLQRFMQPVGKYGDYWLFENREGYRLVEPMEYRPVALKGSFAEWKRFNDRLFTSNISVPVAWVQGDVERKRFSGVLELGNADETLDRLKDMRLEPVQDYTVNQTLEGGSLTVNPSAGNVPVKVKIGYYPSHSNGRVYAGSFNTVVVYPGNRTVIDLG